LALVAPLRLLLLPDFEAALVRTVGDVFVEFICLICFFPFRNGIFIPQLWQGHHPAGAKHPHCSD
jgi:hypothetical protein